MPTFDEREKDFERKYRHDKEMEFKVNARRNKLLGLWAAEEMGLPAEERETYAKSVVMADFAKPGDGDVVEKVLADFEAKNVAIDERRLRKRMAELLAAAKEQIMKEGI